MANVNLPVIPIRCGSQLLVTYQGQPVLVECADGGHAASAPTIRPAPRPGGGFTNYLRFEGVDLPGGPPTIDIETLLRNLDGPAVDLRDPVYTEPIVVPVARSDFAGRYHYELQAASRGQQAVVFQIQD